MSDVKIENLKVAYGDNVIFDDFSIDFAEHKISVVLAEAEWAKALC